MENESRMVTITIKKDGKYTDGKGVIFELEKGTKSVNEDFAKLLVAENKDMITLGGEVDSYSDEEVDPNGSGQQSNDQILS